MEEMTESVSQALAGRGLSQGAGRGPEMNPVSNTVLRVSTAQALPGCMFCFLNLSLPGHFLQGKGVNS